MKSYRYTREEYNLLPQGPGVYKYFGSEGIIYVGKAKNLKKRVSSYFTKAQTSNLKTANLVSEIKFIEIIVVNSEFDALLLESSLIKENQPKYNILLKDGKSYPGICVTNDRFPQIYSTRKIDKSKGKYFGPYTSVRAMDNVLDLLRKLYHIRTCKLNLSPENIAKKKFKVCLEYHLGNCLGPCEGLQREEDYLAEINEAKQILKGKTRVVKKELQNRMWEASAKLNFELAQTFKYKIDYLEKFHARSLVVQSTITETDVFTIIYENQFSFLNYMIIQEGTIKSSETVEIQNNAHDTPESILQLAMLTLRNKYNSRNKTILTNLETPAWPDTEILVPKIGDKKKLVNLSLKNALSYKQDKILKSEQTPTHSTRILAELKENLRLKTIPSHIECFDNSNIQGTNPVASMVCFKQAKPSKKDYRKYNIKNVEGPDDFSSMTEVVSRRYKSLKEKQMPFPDLILVDGGKGQLSAAIKALQDLDLYGQIPVAGIAKKLEEIYLPEDPIPLYMSKKSESLKLLQRIRDEAHRFAITFHRSKRSKASLQSKLESIPGIGKQTIKTLLINYGSIQNIKKVSEEDLRKKIGVSRTSKLLQFLENN